jgi:hypothetical protein
MTTLDTDEATAPPLTDAPSQGARTPEMDRPAGLRARLTALSDRLGDPSVPLALTLVLVLQATSEDWYVRVPVVVLATVGVVVPTIRASARFWLALAATLGAAAWAGRWHVDNHQFLIAYWCLALGLAAASADPGRTRRISARLLVGAVFLLATTWKLLSPDFLDGSFMRFTLLTDPRFGEVAELVGGLDSSDLEDNRAAVDALGDPAGPLDPVRLHSTPRLDRAAQALTWWTVAIEGAVAVTFLTRWRRLARQRDLALIAFLITTYAVAPVIGFGWVLACLGLAQRDRSRRLIPLGYVGAFLLVQVFTTPWTALAGLAA